MFTYSNAHTNAKTVFSVFSSQEIGANLVSFQMVFEALQSSAQAILIYVSSFPGVENPKNPGIQTIHVIFTVHLQYVHVLL